MDVVPTSLASPARAPARPDRWLHAHSAPALPAGAARGAAAGIARRAPETLHPALWLGHQLGRSGSHAVPSGFATLDAELPGGGWPRRVLSELLLPHAGLGEIRLLAPTLVAAQRAGRLVMVFDPPAALSATALARLGLDLEELLVVNTRSRVVPGSDSLWALEQALKSGHVGAVVAWLPPRLRAERLRRLQLAAHNHDGAAFVLREAAAAARPTASPLRLALQAGGVDRLQLRILKRRGPPLEAPLQLALPAVLSNAARRRSHSAREEAPALPVATFVNFA
jgi:protein ImuA